VCSSDLFFKIEIAEFSEIGPGLVLSKMGNIVMGAEKIGYNCTIGHNVTIGLGLGPIGKDRKLPIIGDGVVIEDYSLVYGKINIGSGTKIRRHTVLTKSIPEHSEVFGNPAKLLKLKKNERK
jgi:serine O-acetyltransferase